MVTLKIGRNRLKKNITAKSHQRVLAHVNRKRWWHVPPGDPDAYEKRGMFLASSFKEAEFWGRPNDDPFKVFVARPLVGDEESIETTLFGCRISSDEITVEERWQLDARMRKTALARGYDAIVLMSSKSFAKLKSTGKVPRSLELNVFNRSHVRVLPPH